jgi:hypothetical protein
VQEGERQPALSALLERLEEELRLAIEHEKATGAEPLLPVKECTVELGITWTVEADGKIRFWVLDFTGKATRENAQTITLKLESSEDSVMFVEPSEDPWPRD